MLHILSRWPSNLMEFSFNQLYHYVWIPEVILVEPILIPFGPNILCCVIISIMVLHLVKYAPSNCPGLIGIFHGHLPFKGDVIFATIYNTVE